MKSASLKHTWRLAGVLALALPFVALTACDNDVDNAEDLGEQMDDAVDDAGDAIDDAGDDIDDAIDDDDIDG
jgi:hypothetical protein